MNQLYGTEISYGELIESVYPEVVQYIPFEVMQDMNKTPMVWDTETTLPQIDETATLPQKAPSDNIKGNLNIESVPVIVGCESNLDHDGRSIDYDSGSRVWIPDPYYIIPYMSVLAQLKQESTGSIVASEYECDNNCYDISASGSYYAAQADRYKSLGYHYGTYPAGSEPPGYATDTSSSWYDVP